MGVGSFGWCRGFGRLVGLLMVAAVVAVPCGFADLKWPHLADLKWPHPSWFEG